MKKWMITCLVCCITASLSAQTKVGGGDMYPNRNFIQNASNSADHTTLVAALRSAGLVATLEGNGPFTLFAPTNAAFQKLPKGTMNSLLRPENKPTLHKLLSAHIVPGKWDNAALTKLITEGGGNAQLTTLDGSTLALSLQNGQITLSDPKGMTTPLTTASIVQANGVMYVVGSVVYGL